MPVKSFFVVRHGDKFKLSLDANVWNTPTIAQVDPHLSAHGVDQAKELGAWFATLPESERPQAIYASSLFRTLQTATPPAEALSLPIEVEHGLSEWLYPVKRGRHPRSLPASQLSTWFPHIKPSNRDCSLLYPTQKGETSAEFHERVKEVVARIIDKLDREGVVETVLLSTHAATSIAIGRALVGDSEREIRAGTCAVGKYVRKEGGALGEWEQTMNGAAYMLEKGEERHWDFSHVVECVEEFGLLEDDNDEVLASDRFTETLSADLFCVPEGLLAQ